MKDLRELLTASRRFIDRSNCEWVVIFTGTSYKYVLKSCYDDFYLESIHDVRKDFNRKLKDSDNIAEYDIMKITNKEGQVIWEREEVK